MSKLVIDASVCVKWFLMDEYYVKEAVALKDAFVEGRVELLAPYILPIEWANAINVAILKNRLSEGEWPNFLKDFEDLEITLINPPGLLYTAWDFARRYNRSLYDSVYLALADKEECDMVTGDARLANSLRNHFHRVKWVGDVKIY